MHLEAASEPQQLQAATEQKLVDWLLAKARSAISIPNRAKNTGSSTPWHCRSPLPKPPVPRCSSPGCR